MGGLSPAGRGRGRPRCDGGTSQPKHQRGSTATHLLALLQEAETAGLYDRLVHKDCNRAAAEACGEKGKVAGCAIDFTSSRAACVGTRLLPLPCARLTIRLGLVIGGNKTVALGDVEPLASAGCHAAGQVKLSGRHGGASEASHAASGCRYAEHSIKVE